MPTYAYTCTACGHRFDVRQSMWDAPVTACPQCAGLVRKLISAPLVVLGNPCAAGPAASGGCCGTNR